MLSYCLLLKAINVLSSQDVGSSGDYQSHCSPDISDIWRRLIGQIRTVLPMFGDRKPLDASKAFKVGTIFKKRQLKFT